jgi:hypothetical protein
MLHFKLSYGRADWGGGDIAHGGLPRLMFPPTGNDLKCALFYLQRLLNFGIFMQI